MKLFFGNALWHLLMQSDFVTKCIMLGLLIVSIICWTVIFYKWVQLSDKSKQLSLLLKKFDRIKNGAEFNRIIHESSTLFGGEVVINYIDESKKVESLKIDYQKELLDEKQYLVIDELVFQESSYLLILFIAAACGPLVGLFGTVWGLMHSFMSIAQKHTADIVTVAPGIAEALLTTLAGLLVAIPALIMYHYLVHKIRCIEHDLYKLSAVMSDVSKAFIFSVKD